MSLLYIGIAGNVAALDRASGKVVWSVKLQGAFVNRLKGDFVNLTLEAGDLFASACGELCCLDPATGHIRWTNSLRGLGNGIVTFATAGNVPAGAQRKRDDDEAAATTATIA
jgi:outer membrane protein assembly factor BamB